MAILFLGACQQETRIQSSSANADPWLDFKKDPYSNNSLEQYLNTFEVNPLEEFGSSWYISGVYTAQQKGKPPLLVIDVLEGIQFSRGIHLFLGKRGWLKPGCLIVFDSEGRLLKEIKRQQVSLRERKINLPNPLPDLNGDGFAEIPMHRWATLSSGYQYRQNLVYSTATSDIPCIFTFEYHEDKFFQLGNFPIDDIQYGFLFLDWTSKNPQSISVLCQPAIPKQYIFNLFKKRFGWVKDDSRQPVILETYTWNPQTNKFEGPSEGPDGLWVVK